MKNYYEILEITQDASPEVIKAAYKALVKKLHPDNNGDTQNRGKTIAEVNEAYGILSDSEKKKEYDEEIKSYYEFESEQGPEKQYNSYSEESNSAKQEYDFYAQEESEKTEPEEDYEFTNINIIKEIKDGAVYSVVLFIAYKVLQYLHFRKWVLYICMIICAACLSFSVSSLFTCAVNKKLPIDQKWHNKEQENCAVFFAFLYIRIIFRIYGISNWFTKFCFVGLLSGAFLLGEQIIKTLSLRKEA